MVINDTSLKMYLPLHLLEEVLLILSLGSSMAQNKNLGQIFISYLLSKIQTVKLQFVDN